MGIQRELTYLKDLTAKHGRYLRQYFGFSLKEIALKTGLSPKMFLMVLHGQKKMPEKYQQRFIEVFQELDIENCTKDFKLTRMQSLNRELNKKLLDKRLVFVIILSMVTFAEYIRGYLGDNWLKVKFFKARFEFYSILVFSLVKENLRKGLLKLTSFYEVSFLF